MLDLQPPESPNLPLQFRFWSDPKLSEIYEDNLGAAFFKDVQVFYSNMHNLCVGSKFKSGLLVNAIKNIISSGESYAAEFIVFLGLEAFNKDQEIRFVRLDPVWKNLQKRYLKDLIRNHYKHNEHCVSHNVLI